MSCFKRIKNIYSEKSLVLRYDDIKNNLNILIRVVQCVGQSTRKLNILYIISQFHWCGVYKWQFFRNYFSISLLLCFSMILPLHYIPFQIDWVRFRCLLDPLLRLCSPVTEAIGAKVSTIIFWEVFLRLSQSIDLNILLALLIS